MVCKCFKLAVENANAVVARDENIQAVLYGG